MLKTGDLVRRRSRDEDVVFRIVSIDEDDNVLLKGEVIRLMCTSKVDDLVPCSEAAVKSLSLPPLSETRARQLLKGRVLHLDGDERYLKKALKAYRAYDVRAVGYHLPESQMPEMIEGLLKRHHPDIVVITGHDALLSDGEEGVYELSNYRNSPFFAEAVEKARATKPDLDSMVIIAGACQSYYEALIEAGANFASSPRRENIHLLDPVIIASELATAPVYEYVRVDRILQSTINKNMGGLDTKGQARRIYLGGKSANDT